jgi:acyl carrier protein
MIEEKIKLIVSRQLGIKLNEVTPEASFLHDLDADSLDIVELFMMLEEEFNIEIPDEDSEKMLTVGNVIDYIKEKCQ